MKYFGIYFFTLILFFGYSCKSDKSDLLTYHIETVGNNEKTLADILHFEKFIPLETCSGANISYINRVFLTNDSSIIILDKQGKKVLVFSKEGKFLRPIGKNGNGPGEYVSIRDVAFDRDANEIYIVDLPAKVLVYNTNGDFIRKMKLDFYPQAAFYFNNHLLLYKSGTSVTETDYSLVEVNMDGKVTGGYIPFLQSRGNFTTVLMNCFSQDSKGVKFVRPFDYTVYSFDGKDVNPYITFDFGKYNIPKDVIANCSSDSEFLKIINSQDYFESLASFFELEKYRYLWLSLYRKSYSVYINKETGEVRKYFDQNLQDIFVYLIPYGYFGDSFIYTYYPHFKKLPGANYDFRLKYVKDKIDSTLYEHFTHLLAKDLNENPVVILAKPKF